MPRRKHLSRNDLIARRDPAHFVEAGPARSRARQRYAEALPQGNNSFANSYRPNFLAGCCDKGRNTTVPAHVLRPRAACPYFPRNVDVLADESPIGRSPLGPLPPMHRPLARPKSGGV